MKNRKLVCGLVAVVGVAGVLYGTYKGLMKVSSRGYKNRKEDIGIEE